MSDKPKYTPGPWAPDESGFVQARLGPICQMWDKFEENFANHEANARLIAASPDLLEAGREMIAALELEGASGLRFFEARNSMLAAIKRATEGTNG